MSSVTVTETPPSVSVTEKPTTVAVTDDVDGAHLRMSPLGAVALGAGLTISRGVVVLTDG